MDEASRETIYHEKRIYAFRFSGELRQGVHGYVPENFMASLMGKSALWAMPLAVLIGVPLYSNAAGIIPIIQALLEKGESKANPSERFPAVEKDISLWWQ